MNQIQTELLDLLRDLPVCVGLGVKGDMHKIEQFYIEVSGINLEMAGFIDLSALALIAGYQNPEKISSFIDRLAVDPKWPSRTKSNKKRPRVSSGEGPEPKKRCSTRSKVAEIFPSGTTAALIRESFPNQKGVVVSETALMAENLLICLWRRYYLM